MKLKFLLRLIGPLIFVIIFYFYVDLSELKNILVAIQWPFFALSAAINPLLVYLRSHRWRNILKSYKISYSNWQCFSMYFVEMVVIMVVATVGTFAKVIYLKRDGYGFAQPMLSIVSDKYYDYLLPLIFGITSVLLVWLGVDSDIGLILFALATGLAFFPARQACLLLSSGMIPERLKSLLIKKEWNVEGHLTHIFDILNFRIYLLSVAAFGLYFASIFFLAEGLNLELSFFQVVLIMTITSLIAFIPISFMGIGTRDAALLGVFSFFGRTPEEAVALSMALLLLRIAVVFMGSIFWFVDPPPLSELKESK
ncbi:MAG: lysylphosphatidylglycerol synthase transmembrane domain-containing protein [Desulfobacterales bacterium]|nr:lysylphosphatidylglycerol synthase transmembrane domain-containing protein [Desulfobacterales bacterium]